MVVANEFGDPIVYSKFDSSITELGLTKALHQYLLKLEKESGESL
jgi:hypothetical protein